VGERKKIRKFRGRLNKNLGENELRDYLAAKKETRVRGSDLDDSRQSPRFVQVGKTIAKPKVLLVSPPITIPRYMQKRCIPPLGLCYIAAILEQSGVDVTIIDCVVEAWHFERVENNLVTYGLPPDQLLEKIDKDHYDVVGISVLFSTDLQNVLEISSTLKTNLPEVQMVIGGLHPTVYPNEIFQLDIEQNGCRSVDFVIRGEGEYRFKDFVEGLADGVVDVNADGLVGFVEGEYFENRQIQTIADLDELPFPAYHLLPMERYFDINVPFSPVPKGNRVIPFLTSRGCPIGCHFCANTNTWKMHRKRSTENIIREVRYLKEQFNIDEIQFADDNLTFDRSASMANFKALADEKLIWCTPNGTMVNKLDEELLSVMIDSGLYQITLSLDSANTRTLKELHHKPVNLQSIPGLIEKCREHGVFTHGTLVVGMPGETMEEIRNGFSYVIDHLHFTSVSAFIAAAIPGSGLYHEMLDKGKISKSDARQIDTTKSKINIDLDADSLEKEIEKFQSEFLSLVKLRDPDEYSRKYEKLISSGRWDESQCGGKLT